MSTIPGSLSKFKMPSISILSSSPSSITTFSTGLSFFFHENVIYFEDKNRKIRKINICEHRVLHFISYSYICIFASLAVKTSVSNVNQTVRGWIVSWLVTSYLWLILTRWQRWYCIMSAKSVCTVYYIYWPIHFKLRLKCEHLYFI